MGFGGWLPVPCPQSSIMAHAGTKTHQLLKAGIAKRCTGLPDHSAHSAQSDADLVEPTRQRPTISLPTTLYRTPQSRTSMPCAKVSTYFRNKAARHGESGQMSLYALEIMTCPNRRQRLFLHHSTDPLLQTIRLQDNERSKFLQRLCYRKIWTCRSVVSRATLPGNTMPQD